MKNFRTLWPFTLLMLMLLLGGCADQSESAAIVIPTSATPPAAQSLTRLPVSPTPSPVPTTPIPTATLPPSPTFSPTPAPAVSVPTATPEPTREPTAEPTKAPQAALPAPNIFTTTAWEDRTPFQAGLVDSERAVLTELDGASVYHIDLNLADSMTYLQGRQELLYTNREDGPLAELYLRLFPNLLDGLATLSTLTVNGQKVEPIYELANSAVRLPLPAPLEPGEKLLLQMDFAVQVPNSAGGNYGIFSYLEGILALAHFYPIIPVYDDEGWNVEIPSHIGDIVYADSSFYLVRVTAPASQTLVASGIEIDREERGNHQIVTFAAGPVRDFYLVASDRYSRVSRTVGQITLNSYAPAEVAEGAAAALEAAALSLESFERHFGPYPFTEFDLVSTTNFALGIEYPTIVALLLDMYDRAGRVRNQSAAALLEGVVAHEAGHQWFYSLIGNDQVDEPWLDEALAQYASLLYYADVHGEEGAAGFRRSLQRRWDGVNGADIPVGLPVEAYTPEEYSGIVYGRGPLFIEVLAEEMGQEAFDAFIRDYYQTYRWEIATGADFEALAEQHCGCDLTPLFEAWVYPKTQP